MSGRRCGIVRCIAGNYAKADYDISGHAKKHKLDISIAGKLFLADATATASIIGGKALTSDEHHVAARSIKQHFDSFERDS